jgi:hypothetical protein
MSQCLFYHVITVKNEFLSYIALTLHIRLEIIQYKPKRYNNYEY